MMNDRPIFAVDIEVDIKNLRDIDKHNRWIVSSPFLRDSFPNKQIKSLGSITEDDKFFYELGTVGPPLNWYGGAYDSLQTNVFDLLKKHRPKVFKAMQEGRCILHIDQGWEGFPLLETKVLHYIGKVRDWYESIYAKLEEHNIPPQQLLYSTSNLKEEQIHDEQYGYKKDKITVVSTPMFAGLLSWHCEKDSVSYEQQIAHKTNNENIKLFSCLNRVTRTHRTAFGAMLNHYGLLGHAEFSHNDKTGGHPGNVVQKITSSFVIPPFPPYQAHPAWSEKNVKRFIKKLPFVLDQRNFNWNTVFQFNQNTYLNTWYSIIPETFFQEEYQTSMFLSEKIFKPMLAHQPFIILGHPRSLKYLKALGFKTFKKWWDESYDEIHEPTARMDAICKQTIRLQKLSNSRWLEIYAEMQEVLEHNYNTLTDYMKFYPYREILKDANI